MLDNTLECYIGNHSNNLARYNLPVSLSSLQAEHSQQIHVNKNTSLNTLRAGLRDIRTWISA